MLNKLTQHTALQRLQNQVKVLGNRIADHHVSLAVTGLSKSGKTAFITSLLNQLLNARESADLPFFTVVKQGRLVGVKRDVPSTSPTIQVNGYLIYHCWSSIISSGVNSFG